MNTTLVGRIDQELFIEPVKQHWDEKPLLAHYSSTSVVEMILRNKELWFSHPLYMNDFEEFKLGMTVAREAMINSECVKSLSRSNAMYSHLTEAYIGFDNYYQSTYAANIFIACFSSHHPDDCDGLLSMWRAYGGEGSGAALVFDSGALEVVQSSPIIVLKVEYMTIDKRRKMIDEKIARFCDIASSVVDQQTALACNRVLFESLKLYALTTKNWGFREEMEWRAVYFPERDSHRLLTKFINYWVGPFGIEPKLKLPLQPVAGAVGDGVQLENSLRRIILGPTRSSKLSCDAFKLMLDRNQLGTLADRVRSSSIPLRERGHYG